MEMPRHDPVGYLSLEACCQTTPYHLRPDDYRDPRSPATEGQWREANQRRIAGHPMADIARFLGISDNRAAIGLRKRFGLKRDHAGAVNRPRGAAALPGSPHDRASDPLAAFRLDPSDPDASRAAIRDKIVLATDEGALGRVVALCRVMRELDRSLWPAGKGAGGAGGMPSDPDDEPAGVPAPALILHPHQCPPDGDWATWLVLAGRGAGKTLAGANWVADRALALGKGGRIALIGATLHDVREVMIEGPSGLMSLPRWQATGRWKGPRFQPSRRRLSFPGGCEGQIFSAEDPDSLRGPQFHAAWADEFCAWGRTDPEAGALAMVRLGLRLASAPGPQLMVTTTPRPTRALKDLMAEPGCRISRAATGANAAHLSEGFVAGLRRLYGGTRLEAQEIEGQVVDDGLALWTAPMLAACRGFAPERFEAVVVGVDPSVTAGGHACGIVVVGRAGDRAYVLADRTMGGVSPDTWARAAVQAAVDYEAQAVVAEVNQGGDLVTGLLRAVGGGVAVRAVRASVGKRARAEPVAALYEQGRVVHVGAGLDRLEEALMDFDGEGDGQDRADALVWAVTEVMLGPPPLWPRIRVW